MLRKIVNNPLIQLGVGLVLLISIFTEYLHFHFGLIGVGVYHVLQALPNLLQGMERLFANPKARLRKAVQTDREETDEL